MNGYFIAQEGANEGLIFAFTEGEEWIIGRDFDACDFVLDGNTISRKHARITKTEDGIYLKNLSRTNRVKINEDEIKGSTLLKEGDLVQIGPTLFKYTKKAPEGFAKAPPPSGYDAIFSDLSQNEPTPFTTHPESTDVDSEESSFFSDATPDEQPQPLEQEEELPDGEPREKTVYDTIFEDLDDDAFLPYALGKESPLTLKVISGPNAGAEIGLDKGRSYILGKDPKASDIVFQDLSVSREHAKLSISEDGALEIADFDSKNKTLINGKAIEEPTSFTPSDLISLGTTLFLVIDREAPQETIYSPLLPQAFSSTEEGETKEIPTLASLKEPPSVDDWKKTPIPRRYLILGGAVSLLTLTLLLMFFSLFRSKSLEDSLSPRHPDTQIASALKAFPHITFSYNSNTHKIFLTGHIQTVTDAKALYFALEELPFIQTIENSMIIDEYVVKTTNELISTHSEWASVYVSAPDPGHFVVRGYLTTSQEIETLFDYLTLNFPYLDLLHNQVTVETTLKSEIEQKLRSQGFGSLQFELIQGKLVLSGLYSEKKKSQLHHLLDELSSLPGVASLQDAATAVRADLASIDLSSQFTVGGSSLLDGKGFSVVLNGKIYTLGDQVEGMQIVEIRPNTILLEKDGLKYKIEYGRG
jgi:type III secretion system YscD/HrpQ family protein